MYCDSCSLTMSKLKFYGLLALQLKYGNIANSFENFPAVYQLTRNANGKVDKHKT